MGIYDIVHVKKITCPQCSEENENFEFHIKLLKNYSKMHVFTFPDLILDEDATYNIDGICTYCSAYIKGKTTIENNLMKKITYWVENCPVRTIRADFEEAYRDLKEATLKKEE